MKLSHWAKKQGITYLAAWRMFSKGLLPEAYKLPTGTIIVPEQKQPRKEYTVVYARVSSSQNRSNLEKQAERVTEFCRVNGWVVNEIVCECASGLNDRRPKLEKILTNQEVTRIVVEHKDRLTRFGFHYLKLLSYADITVINEVEEDESDLMQDFVSLVTSFCARLYGKRRSRRKTEQLIASLKEDQNK
jgi:putative resolvase